MKSHNAFPHLDIASKPEIEAFFDDDSNTISYLVNPKGEKACAVIDTVMDFNYAAGRTSFESADRMIAKINERGLKLEWLIETHAHADHLSAAPYIQSKLGGKIGIGREIITVQNVFGKIFNEGTEFERDGSQFDALFDDGDSYDIGSLKAFVLHTPGHTPADMVHVIGDAAFCGDTLFMPDGGTARADFPGGDAGTLYDSIQRVLTLPDEMRLFMCHDYGPGGREIMWETTVAAQKMRNIHVGKEIGQGVERGDFVALREARDATLKMPRLLVPSIQVNMRAGKLPEAEGNGTAFIKVPLNVI